MHKLVLCYALGRLVRPDTNLHGDPKQTWIVHRVYARPACGTRLPSAVIDVDFVG